jgi:hypothetical protein
VSMDMESSSQKFTPTKRRYPLGDYGLVVVLGLLFLGSWGLQAIFQVGVNGDTWGKFWASTMENWQSEYLQLFSFVALTTYLIFRGSHESRDSDDEVNEKLDEILRRLDENDDQRAG